MSKIVANDKKRNKMIFTVVIVLAVIFLLIYGILGIFLSKYILPENTTIDETDNGYNLSNDGTVNIDGIVYKKKDDGNFSVISADKEIVNGDIRDKINETDEYVVNEIGEKAFENCEKLTSIMIPDTIIKINNYAFHGCKALGTVTIPYSVEEIGDSCFYECDNLSSIKVAVANKKYTHHNGVLYDIEGKKLYVYPHNKSDEEYKLSDNLESIENNVFRGFEKLKSVTLPESVTHIGDTAFEGCKNLDSVLVPKSVTSIGSDAFSNCSEKLTIYGEKNSYAEEYAKKNNITFKLTEERTNTNENTTANTITNTNTNSTSTNTMSTNNITNNIGNNNSNNTNTNSSNVIKSIIEIQ